MGRELLTASIFTWAWTSDRSFFYPATDFFSAIMNVFWHFKIDLSQYVM